MHRKKVRNCFEEFSFEQLRTFVFHTLLSANYKWCLDSVQGR
jgi:hypothetical protein